VPLTSDREWLLSLPYTIRYMPSVILTSVI